VRNDLSIYDTVSPWWDPVDPLFAPLRALAPARMAYLRRAGLTVAGRRVLDVGCGGGFMSEPLAAAGGEVIGVDIAPGALEAAAARLASRGLTADLRLGEGAALPVEGGSVDLVVCTDVLVHVPDPAAVIREIGRVLRPGGALLVSTISRTWLARLVMITLGEDLLGLVHRGTHDPEKFIRPAELSGWLSEAGLTLAGLEGVGPVGLDRRGRLRFGRHPTLAVMVQGHALLP
jgi:2-polyprenyl-6-hydroxyphenyl methylase/3-demethylubiquinone-9 3-methyltransferase